MKSQMPLAALAFVLHLSSGLRAEESPYQPPEFISAPLEHPDVASGTDGWTLALSEALSLAARNNLGIVLERETLKIAELQIDLAEARFEPSVSGAYGRTNTERFAATLTEGPLGSIVTDKTHVWRVGVEKSFSTGTTASASWQNVRNTSISDQSQPPFYGSNLELRLSQPLLRGFSLDLKIPRIQVLRAKLGSKKQREQARSTLMRVTEETETAYWGLARALGSYQVQKSSLALAKAQMDLTTRQIAAGVLAQADAIEAESTLAQRELALISAKRAIDAASDRLRGVLNLPRAQWSRPIVPGDKPAFEPRPQAIESALQLALENRPEARQAKLDVSNTDYELREANNNRLPQIDLGLTYGVSGQGERYRGALDGLAERGVPSWSVLMSLTWTPLNRQANAQAEVARSGRRIALAQNEQAVQSIFSEVREASRNLESAQRQLMAAARFRSLAERSFDAEQRKFAGGTSSNFLVAQRSESVARAQLAELDALVAHRLAAVALDRATGELLDKRNIKVE